MVSMCWQVLHSLAVCKSSTRLALTSINVVRDGRKAGREAERLSTEQRTHLAVAYTNAQRVNDLHQSHRLRERRDERVLADFASALDYLTNVITEVERYGYADPNVKIREHTLIYVLSIQDLLKEGRRSLKPPYFIGSVGDAFNKVMQQWAIMLSLVFHDGSPRPASPVSPAPVSSPAVTPGADGW